MVPCLQTLPLSDVYSVQILNLRESKIFDRLVYNLTQQVDTD